MKPLPVLGATALLWLTTAAQAAPHQHGVARLDVAADGPRLELALESPLDNLLGFERAPRTEAERQQARALVARLRTDAALWRIDPSARCAPAGVEVQAPVLGEGAAAAAGAGAHADLDATWRFDCAGGPPAWIDTGLFAAFARLQRLDVQVAAPRGQAQRTLRRPAARIELPR